MNTLLKCHAVGLPETKIQRRRKFDEMYRVCISIFVCEESKKIDNDEKRWRQAEETRLIIDNEK